MTTAAFCEIEPYCQKVLQKNFPGIPIYDDVRTITKKQLEEDGVIDDSRSIDILTAGIPCQPFSVAGKQRGKDDERYLWPETLRIIRELRPSWVLIENVSGFVKMALDTVCADLESEGYACQPYIIPAEAVGAPHKRERVWIVAHSSSNGNNSKKEYRTNSKWTEEMQEWDQSQRGSSNISETMADTNSKRLQGSQDTRSIRGSRENVNKQPARFNQEPTRGTIERRLGGDASRIPSWLDGYNHRWPALFGEPQHEYEPPRVIQGQKHRKERLKALGNTIVPQVAYEIMRAIKQIEVTS